MILIDSHVHIYDLYSVKEFLDSALANFHKASKNLSPDIICSKVVILTESGLSEWFNKLSSFARPSDTPPQNTLGDWRIQTLEEKNGLRAVNKDQECIFIISGRQYVAAENIEVLSLFTDDISPGIRPATSLMKCIIRSGGLPVLPWSPGKWLGKRGKVLENIINDFQGHDFLLGDIMGKPKLWPKSRLFHLAGIAHINIISGTDPLPLANEHKRIGQFGTAIFDKMEESSPSEHLKDLLVQKSTQIQNYGQRLSLFHFIKNQIFLRIYQRNMADNEKIATASQEK